jgi:succinate dehydrogenase/fumarate reductase flavoprotein subunit
MSQFNGGDRRSFLKASTAAIGASLASGAMAITPGQHSSAQPTMTADVIVVGSGGAAMSAAVAAHGKGASVILLEKGGAPGGTTAKSGGGCWVPNNHVMRKLGRLDPKTEAVAYMLNTAWPTRFRPDDPQHGLPQEYALIEAFYDNAASTFEALESSGIIQWQAMDCVSYSEHTPGGEVTHRTLFPTAATGQRTGGQALIRLFREWCARNDVPILLRHEVQGLILGEDGRVSGVEGVAEGVPFIAKARRGVVFASGGFSHDEKLMKRYISPALRGACGSTNARGDFVRIASRHGAEFGNMFSGWKTQAVVEELVRYGSVPDGVWQVPGDSSILVNKFGRRIVDEKRDYNDRVQVHTVFDPVEQEYPNLLLFMIYDQRTAELYASDYPLPTEPAGASYVISAPNLTSLAANIQARLLTLDNYAGLVRLGSDFADVTRAQIERFNRDVAAKAHDQFDRDKYPFDVMGDRLLNPPRRNTRWNVDDRLGTRHEIALDGPLYCIILAGTVMDTNGGPIIDATGRIMHVDGHPIKGLYGAGNCIASPAGQTYWGPGGTLGPAITFGAIAGRAAAQERA